MLRRGDALQTQPILACEEDSGLSLGSALPLLSEVTRATSAVWRHFDDTKEWISNWFRRDLWLFDIWWTDLGNELAWLISVLAAWVWIRRVRQWTTVA